MRSLALSSLHLAEDIAGAALLSSSTDVLVLPSSSASASADVQAEDVSSIGNHQVLITSFVEVTIVDRKGGKSKIGAW